MEIGNTPISLRRARELVKHGQTEVDMDGFVATKVSLSGVNEVSPLRSWATSNSALNYISALVVPPKFTILLLFLLLFL